VAREGWPIIGLAAFATAVLALVGFKSLAVLGLAFTAFSVYFFRDPDRPLPAEAEAPGALVSPADGKVVKIGPMVDPFTGVERTCVCVFMNVFNVHVNRSPLDATVRELRYTPGRFFNASLDKASEHNERLALGLEDEAGDRFTVVQIAGLIARRIVCRAEIGDRLERGERFGMIRFGSRVDLYVPDGYEITVRLGHKTIAGQTVLARRKV
jgi:phosphatidylserine decarboxylase